MQRLLKVGLASCAFAAVSAVTPHRHASSASTLSSTGSWYSMQQYHNKVVRTVGDVELCRKIQQQAWRALQSVTNEQLDQLSTNEIAEMLEMSFYFSRYWERGIDGPTDGGHDSALVEPVEIPVTSREETAALLRAQRTRDMSAPPPRANPLDEIIEF